MEFTFLYKEKFRGCFGGDEMIVKVEFLDEEDAPFERGEDGDRVILAIDKVMKGASWESSGNGWIARR